MKQIIVMSANQAEKFHPVEEHIWISIRDPNANELKLNTNEYTKGVLRLWFDDAENDQCGFVLNELKRKVLLFQEEQAEEIFNFLDEHKNVGLLFVHCNAGMSRSPAIASILARIYGIDHKEFHESGRFPNGHVMSVMRKVYYELTGKIIY